MYLHYRDLKATCNETGIRELCIIRKENNTSFVKMLANEFEKNTNWFGSQFCIIKNVQHITDESTR